MAPEQTNPTRSFSQPACESNLILTPILPSHTEIVLPMVLQFYRSDAVDHPVAQSVLEQTLQDVADPNNTLITGYLIEIDGIPIGFLYLTFFYACEVGGLCVMLEEIYIKEEFQGKGFGKSIFQCIHQAYPHAKRFRLEVTAENQGAKQLYQRLGYQFLGYQQMVLDLPTQN